MTDLLDRVLIPVGSVEDAEATCRAVGPYLRDTTSVVAVHVIEKAGGAPDKASVEQREQDAIRIFDTVHEHLEDVETEILYGTDVAETIIDAGADHDATAIVFTPRGGSRWIRLLAGDVADELVNETDRPVIVLPDEQELEEEAEEKEAEEREAEEH